MPAATAQNVNYRHAFHAGNFADVVKHVALVAILLHLRKKEKPFRVIDTHAGRGLYDLESEAAVRTGEAARRHCAARPICQAGPPALATYLDIVRNAGAARYPGSPLIAAQLLREQDKLIAIERHPDDERALASSLARFKNAKCFCADGYQRLAALLPPPERRGLVLIDPPFEAADEFVRLADALAAARKRFATGIYLVWYPIKSIAASDALSGEVLADGSEEVLRITIDVGRANRDDKERLSAAGLLVVNPPYGLAEEMKAVAEILGPRLGRHVPAHISFANLDVRLQSARDFANERLMSVCVRGKPHDAVPRRRRPYRAALRRSPVPPASVVEAAVPIPPAAMPVPMAPVWGVPPVPLTIGVGVDDLAAERCFGLVDDLGSRDRGRGRSMGGERAQGGGQCEELYSTEDHRGSFRLRCFRRLRNRRNKALRTSH